MFENSVVIALTTFGQTQILKSPFGNYSITVPTIEMEHYETFHPFNTNKKSKIMTCKAMFDYMSPVYMVSLTYHLKDPNL